jgi:hypothetical protein
MTPIRHILRWGTGEWATILMSCGHSRHVRRTEFDRAVGGYLMVIRAAPGAVEKALVAGAG